MLSFHAMSCLKMFITFSTNSTTTCVQVSDTSSSQWWRMAHWLDHCARCGWCVCRRWSARDIAETLPGWGDGLWKLSLARLKHRICIGHHRDVTETRWNMMKLDQRTWRNVLIVQCACRFCQSCTLTCPPESTACFSISRLGLLHPSRTTNHSFVVCGCSLDVDSWNEKWIETYRITYRITCNNNK